jgi:parallel beta-helix repeat protein
MTVSKTFATLLGLTAPIALCARLAVSARTPAPTVAVGDCTKTLSAGADLQQAIDAIAAGGRTATLCLGPGEFPLRHLVVIGRDGLTLRGEGSSTVLRLEKGAASPVIVIGDFAHEIPRRAISSVTVERLRVVGGGAEGSEFLAGHPFLSNSAIVVRRGQTIVLRDLEITACRSACILTEHDSRNVSIERSSVSGSVWDGISLNRTAHARLVGNTIRDNTAAGITAEHLVDSVIRDNTLADNRTHGVYLSDSYRNTVAGNRFSANVVSGVFLTCAVHDHSPVRCWRDSMSRSNVFERNEFIGNRVGYMIGADDVANCTMQGFVPNLSCGDAFSRNPPESSDAARYGRCVRFSDDCSG